MVDMRLEINRYIGSRLRQQRLIQGLSEAECAERLSITEPQLRLFEKGIKKIPPPCLIAAARTFKVSIGYFFEEAPPFIHVTGHHSADADLLRFLALPEAYPLIRSFIQINARKRRQAVVDYVEAVAGLVSDHGSRERQPKTLM